MKYVVQAVLGTMALTLSATAAIAQAPVANPEEWYRLGQSDDGSTLYVHIETARKSKTAVANKRLWIQADTPNDENFVASRSLYSVNCANGSVRILQHTGYDRAGETSTVNFPPEDSYPQPDSAMAMVMRTICE